MHAFKSWFLRGGLFAFVLSLLATAVSAETLLMPKRDGLAGTPIVVWGTTTLPNGTAFTLDYGDASSSAGTVGDRSYINFSHNYAAAGNYDVTLTVGAESATVKVQIFNPAAVTADQLRGLKINMAIEDGLRYFWQAQANRAANFPANVFTDWGGDLTADTSLVVLAFENHGYKLTGNVAPTGVYEKYIVRRGLNRILASVAMINLSAQAAGNPCVGSGPGWSGADCVGLTATSDPGYATAVAMLPFAASGALSRVNTEVPGQDIDPAPGIQGYLQNKTFGEILQRLVNAEAFGQSDANCGAGRGGFGYNHNGCQFDGSTVGWSILGFLDAEAAGAVVPAFVRPEFTFGFNNALNNDGSFDYGADGSPNNFNSPGPQKVGIGLQGLFFLNDTGARVNLVKTNISSWWNGTSGIGGNNWWCGAAGNAPNKGCAYSMFNNFKGLKLNGITTLPGVTRPAGPGTQPAGDWYADYQDWLVANQTSPNTPGGGYWGTMGFSCCNHRSNFTNLNAAIAELILSPVALVLPDEEKFSTVGLSPATKTLIELGTHTVTAKAESTGGTPVPGATVNFTILSGPNAGLTGTDTTDSNGEATFTYTDAGPDGTVGTDKIQASIGNLDSNIVDMIWLPKNAPPVAGDDSAATYSGTPLTVTVLVNDSDPDAGDTIRVTSVSGNTANATVTLNPDGTVTYAPADGFAGTETFTYTIVDSKGATDTATVTIEVAKRLATVTAVTDSKVYGSADPSLVPAAVGFLPADGIALSGSRDAGENVGSYVTYGEATGAKVVNYDVTYKAGLLTITPATLTVTASSASVHYGNPAPAISPNYAGFQFTDGPGSLATQPTCGSAYTTTTPVGTIPTSCSGGVASNYAFAYVPGVLEITNIAPACEVNPAIRSIWPPNHKLVTLSPLTNVTDGDGDVLSLLVTSIRQDEPTNDNGDGNTAIDGYGVGTSTAQVRAERTGDVKNPGNGRVYYISYTATDPAGGSCTGTFTAGVPHDQGGRATPIGDGPNYDSTVATVPPPAAPKTTGKK